MMNPPRRRLLGLAASAAALPILAQEAVAQAFPSHPLTMVVPASAGGPTDAIARIMA
jgi:tripartite-type tricarboxylate transporter receptor subunit TctC